MNTRKFLTSRPSKALRLILIFGVVGVIAFVSRPLDHLEYETIQLFIVCGVCLLLVWAELFWQARFPGWWIALFFSGVGAWGIYSDQLERHEAKASVNFAPTMGTVVRTYAQNSGFGTSRWHTEYVVTYEYVIDGQRYKSSNVRYPNLKVWNTDPNKYPEHSRICVYYDPCRPSHSCLERGYNRQLGGRGNYIYFLHLATQWFFLITGITLVLSPMIRSLISIAMALVSTGTTNHSNRGLPKNVEESNPNLKADKLRTEIMLQKRTAEMNFRFKNRELAERYALGPFERIFTILGIVLLFVAALGIVLFFWTGAFQNLSGVLLVLASVIPTMSFILGVTMLYPFVLRLLRKPVYAKASELVLHQEPVRVFAKLDRSIGAGGHNPWFVQTGDVKNSAEAHFSLHFLALGVDGSKLLEKHPELRRGAEVEIYFNSKGHPLGMFANDHVDWFI